MKLNDFLNGLEAYYGKYNSHVKKAIGSYLDGRLYEKELAMLYEWIISEYSRRWKEPPDIAIIRETMLAYGLEFIKCKYCGTRDSYHEGACISNQYPEWSLLHKDGKVPELIEESNIAYLRPSKRIEEVT